MKVFLTGTQQQDWRGEMTDFLHAHHIEFFDACPASHPPVSSSISTLNQFKILESCDSVIAYFSEWERRPLQSILQLSYASKLAKEVMVVDATCQTTRWTGRWPYSHSFANLDGLKQYLLRATYAHRPRPCLFG